MAFAPSPKPRKRADSISIKFEGEERTTEELEAFKKKLQEDDRLDSIFRMGENLTEKFDNRVYLHPHGMTDFDYKGIPLSRRDDFEKFKHKTRHEIYGYMSEHKEVDALLALFFKKILIARPQDSVHFAAEFFTKTTAEKDFKNLMHQEMERLSRYRVAKMKAAEKITTVSVPAGPKKVVNEKVDPCALKKEKEEEATEDLSIDPLEAMKLQEGVLNWLKKLNIGPLAQDFDTHKVEPPVVEIKQVLKKKKKIYCGCKDPGRREIAHPKNRPKAQPSQVKKESIPIKNSEVDDNDKPNSSGTNTQASSGNNTGVSSGYGAGSDSDHDYI